MAGALTVSFKVTEKGKNTPEFKLESDLRGETTLAQLFNFSQLALISIFNDVLKEEQGKGFTKTPRTRVDNNFFKPVINVRPFGKLQAFDTQNVLEILDDIYKGLTDRSRIKTGNYITSHVVFFRDVLIARSFNELQIWIQANKNRKFQQSDKFDFINLAPYARKLESRGLAVSATSNKNVSKTRRTKSSKGGKVRRPNGAYFKTAKSIKRKFGQASGNVKFQYRPAAKQARAFNSGRAGPSGVPFRTHFKSRSGAGRPYIYPSIQYKIDLRGVQQ